MEPQYREFDRLRSYDALSNVIAQGTEGELTFGSFKDAFLSPNKLSPEQRTLLRHKLIGESTNPLAKAAVGVITNPWVWLGFLTSPVGGAALGRTMGIEGSLFNIKAKYTAFARGTKMEGASGVALSPLRRFLIAMQTPVEAVTNTGVDTTALAMSARIAEVKEEAARSFKYMDSLGVTRAVDIAATEAALLERVRDLAEARGLKRTAIKSLAVGDHLRNDQARAILEEMNDAMAIVQGGYGERVQRMVKALENDYKIKFADGSHKMASELAANELFLVTTGRSSEDLVEAIGEHARHNIVTGASNLPTDIVQVQKVAPTLRDVGEVTEEAIGDIEVAQSFLRQLGPEAGKYMDETQALAKREYVRTIGDEQRLMPDGVLNMVHTDFAIDERKMNRLMNSMAQSLFENQGQRAQRIQGASTKNFQFTLQGQEIMHSLLDPEMVFDIQRKAANAKSAKESLALVERAVRETLTPDNWTGSFLPRNNIDINPFHVEGGKRVYASQMERRLANQATGHAFHPSSSLFPRTSEEVRIHIDSLERMKRHGMLTEAGEELLEKEIRRSDRAHRLKPEMGGGPGHEGVGNTFGYRLDYTDNMKRYVDGLHETRALHTSVVPEEVLRLDEDVLMKAREVAKVDAEYADHLAQSSVTLDWRSPHTKGMKDPRSGLWRANKSLWNDLPPEVREELTFFQVMRAQTARIKDEHTVNMINEVLMPGALSKGGIDVTERAVAEIQRRKSAAHFLESPFAQEFLPKLGPLGKAIREWFEQTANPTLPVRGRGGFSGKLASYLYGTHLGANPYSVLLNMTQPLILAATTGRWQDTAGAYADAIGEMAHYIAKRVGRYGFKGITDQQRMELLRETHKFTHQRMNAIVQGEHVVGGHKNLLGIGPDVLKDVDHAIVTSKGEGGLVRFLMKGFEKSEWVNRNVAAHVLDRMYRSGGNRNYRGTYQFAQDVERLVMQTQFGAGNLNTLVAFQNPNNILNNPLMRMFLTFPTRTVTAATAVFPKLGGREYGSGALNFGLRAMAMNAAFHEVSSNLFDVDLSRGLFAGAVSEPFAPFFGDPTQGYEWGSRKIGLPPAIDISTGLVGSLISGDTAEMINQLYRLTPGGVALHKAMGMTPIGNGRLRADWSNPLPDGKIPVYQDDRLLRYENPSMLVARAAGVDMGRWGEESEFARYLVVNNDEIKKKRHALMMALGAGNYSRAESIRKQFRKEYGFELTISQAQVNGYLRGQTQTRAERVTQTLDRNLRPAALEYAERSNLFPNVAPGDTTEGFTAAQRDRVISQDILDQEERLYEELSRLSGQ